METKFTTITVVKPTVEELEQQRNALILKIDKLEYTVKEQQKTIKEQQICLEQVSELRAEIMKLQTELNKKCDEIAEKNYTINNLKNEQSKLLNKVETYKLDNFDLQADNDRLRHQLEAIKNIIAL